MRGTLTLSDASNTYAGGTTITGAGALVINADGDLGTAPSPTAVTNITLNQAEPLQFVGLKNYETLLGDRQAWDALAVTLKFALLALPVAVCLPLLVALMLHSRHLRCVVSPPLSQPIAQRTKHSPEKNCECRLKRQVHSDCHKHGTFYLHHNQGDAKEHAHHD